MTAEASMMHQAFRSVLLTFYKSAKDGWSITAGDKAKIKSCLAHSLAPNDSLLSSRLAAQKGDLSDALVPISYHKDRGCLIYAEWDFSGDQVPRAQISVLMLPSLRRSKDKRFIGYRFDSPHDHPGNSGDRHRYWHAQPIRSLGELKGRIPAAEGLEWMPDDVPAFPIAAWTPVSLLAAAIYSVLGAEAQQTIKSAAQKAGYNDVKEVIRAVDLDPS
jgi:hypothetical protein